MSHRFHDAGIVTTVIQAGATPVHTWSKELDPPARHTFGTAAVPTELLISLALSSYRARDESMSYPYLSSKPLLSWSNENEKAEFSPHE